MKFFEELKSQNIINNITNENKLKTNKYDGCGVYVGFDPTFKSLHIGNYYMLVTLNKFKLAGFKTYALIGGATGMIGDPSGKKAERKTLDIKIVNENVESISKQIANLTNAKIINNFGHYKSMNILTFLRDIGKEINVNYLLEKETIKTRLSTGISFTEFTYALMQAYDFLKLYTEKDIYIQLGGSDQWGNITTGIELIRKKTDDQNKAIGITLNLLTKADGTKFGKSEKGAIYLDKNITSPYEIYQFLVQTDDQDVEKLLNSLTYLSIKEIKEIIEKHLINKSLKFAQKQLAYHVVCDIHGKQEAEKCLNSSSGLFTKDFDKLNPKELYKMLSNVPSINISSEISILDALVQLNACPSKSAARKLIEQNSIHLNGKLITDVYFVIKKESLISDKFCYIKKGKKNFYLVNWSCQ